MATVQEKAADLPSLLKEDTCLQGARGREPLIPSPCNTPSPLLSAILSTAVFRCWHILGFFAAWSTLITVLNEKGVQVVMHPTLLTVAGTVLGFVISYRTTASFERYNEGRRLWSQNILATRTMARTIWLHVPDTLSTAEQSLDQSQCRSLIEKKSVINLIEAFSVAIKHFLRGEDGIYYQDLYHLVKFLPAYNFSPSIAANGLSVPPDLSSTKFTPNVRSTYSNPSLPSAGHGTLTSVSSITRRNGHVIPEQDLPIPVTMGPPGRRPSQLTVHNVPEDKAADDVDVAERILLNREDEKHLMPGYMPPESGLLDHFLFPTLVELLASRGRRMVGRRAARIHARKVGQREHSLPLEISFYISSYISALQKRKICDVPTINALVASLNQLVDGFTGLERILTSPIPFSYSFHLWTITTVYCLALPLQIYDALKWLTIPGTTIVCFIFFGFLVAGEEIEDPFGYDKNDLNLDYFTQNIIRKELQAITSAPPPDPASWAFVPENDLLFTNALDADVRRSPEDWLAQGSAAVLQSLSMY